MTAPEPEDFEARAERLGLDDVERSPEADHYSGWIEAFNIFAKNAAGVTPDFAAEHDVFYASGDPSAMSDAELTRLAALQWYWDEDVDSFRRFT